MKSMLVAAALGLLATPVFAQAPQKAIVVNGAQLAAITARARAAQEGANPARPNSLQPIISAAPYTLNLEHRVGRQSASIHQAEAEVLIVLSGSATFTTGGTLVGAAAPANGNVTGTDITGGTVEHVVPGDMMMVPEGTAHMLQLDGPGPLVMATLHLPRNGAPAGGRGGAPKLLTHAADLPAMIEKAKAAVPASARFFGGDVLLSLPPYRAGLEYRSPKGIASVHKNDGEFMFVIRGAGNIPTGGTVTNPKDTGANIDGDDMVGATDNFMKAGDFIFVPKGLPHKAISDGEFVLMTLHVP